MLGYTRTGTGEPLILVHGVGHHRHGWDPVVPLLAPHRDVIAVDLPGHGESPDLPGDFAGDVGPVVDAIEGFVAELGLERPHVAGNSLGGLIALHLAARGSVASATALSPAGFWATPGRLWARATLGAASAALTAMSPATLERLLSYGVTRAAVAGLVIAHPSRTETAELAAQLGGLAHPRTTFHTLLGALENWTIPSVSTVPTTVGWGARDYLLAPRRQVGRLRAALPDARVYLLPSCGHVPMADDPELTADLVLAGSRPRPEADAAPAAPTASGASVTSGGSGDSVTSGASGAEPARPTRKVASPRMRRPGG